MKRANILERNKFKTKNLSKLLHFAISLNQQTRWPENYIAAAAEFPGELSSEFGIPTMLHELLLALLGYTGDLIIDERERRESLHINISPEAPLADEPTFKLASDLSFIEPSDRYHLFIFAAVIMLFFG